MTELCYTTSLAGVRAEQLEGFFEGWPKPPTPETHLRLLAQSDLIVLAIDAKADRVVGFITALTDGVLAAYIPLLEVLPAYRGKGIGSELVRRVLEVLGELYAIDLLCDAELQPFYEALGMQRATGMMVRHYAGQAGR